jgi:DNA-binding NarL/FixJ family response regulator
MTLDIDIVQVMIVDDHFAARAGLCALIDKAQNMRVVAMAANGQEALSQFHAHRPKLVLMDLQMPGMRGLDAAKLILEESPATLLVALTCHGGDAYVARALAVGMRAYLLKTSRPEVVSDALQRVLKGEVVVDPQVSPAARCSQQHLTEKEVNVVKLIAEGNQNSEIGEALDVTVHTVKQRIKAIFSKLGAKDRAHAVTLARNRGFLDF